MWLHDPSLYSQSPYARRPRIRPNVRGYFQASPEDRKFDRCPEPTNELALTSLPPARNFAGARRAIPSWPIQQVQSVLTALLALACFPHAHRRRLAVQQVQHRMPGLPGCIRLSLSTVAFVPAGTREQPAIRLTTE